MIPLRFSQNGHDSSTLSLGPAQWPHRGLYWATISNTQGSVESNKAHLYINSNKAWSDLPNNREPAQSFQIGKIDRNLGIHSQGSDP